MKSRFWDVSYTNVTDPIRMPVYECPVSLMSVIWYANSTGRPLTRAVGTQTLTQRVGSRCLLIEQKLYLILYRRHEGARP